VGNGTGRALSEMFVETLATASTATTISETAMG